MNLHDKTMHLIEDKLQIDSTHNEYEKFCHLITVVNIAYLKTAIYTFSEHLKNDDFSVESKFDYLMKIYNQLLREHQVVFLLFNLFETALRSKLAYMLSKKHSTDDMDDWLKNEEKVPQKIKVVLNKVKGYISQDNGNLEEMSTYEIFDYVMLGDLKAIYYDFWSDVGHLFKDKDHKGHALKEIGRGRFRDMLDEIRKARNDIAHHKPLHNGRKKRYKLIEDIEHILLHIGYNLEEAINNIDPEHKIIKIGYYENTNKVKQLLKNPSKKNLKEIKKLCQYRGIKNFFQKELLNSDLIGWYSVLEEQQYFETSNFPKPNADNYLPFWKELDFLEQISKNFQETEYQELEAKCLAIIDSFTAYIVDLSSSGFLIYLHNDWQTFKIIQNFKPKHLTIRHISFIRESFLRHQEHNPIGSLLREDFLKNILLCDNDLIVEFYKVILGYEASVEKYSDKIKPLVKIHQLKKILSNSIKLLNSAQANMLASVLVKEVKEIAQIDKFAFSSLKIPSIEKSTQRRNYNRNFPVLLVDFTRDIFEMQNAKDVKSNIRDMLNDEEIIMKRFAVHLINIFFNDLKKLFFEYEKGNLFDDSLGLLHENYVFLENHVDDFTKDEVGFIIECIETQDFTHFKNRDKYDEYRERWEAYRKRKYLYALKSSTQYPECLDLFDKYDSMLEGGDEHPAYDVYSSGIQRLEKISPISKEEIQQRNTDELVNYINNEFKEDKSQFNAPSHEGLAAELSSIILSDPEIYINELEKFIILDEKYFHKIIDAYRQCLEQDIKIDLIKVFEYILSYIEDHKKDSNLRYWHISYPISELIKELSSSEKYQIDEILHDLIIQTLIQVDITINEDYEDKEKDYISHLLNSSIGRMYIAMIEYSLKYARENKLETDRWIPSIKELFKKSLKSKTSINIFTALGYYLPNIRYLDNDWLEENFEIIFGSNVLDKYWEAAFTGYLSDSNVNLEFYNRMLDLGVLDRGLNCEFSEEYTERIVGYICVSYNSENEFLNNPDSMICKLLQKSEKKQLEYCIDFFVNRSEEENFTNVNLIKPLWQSLYVQIEENNYLDLHIKLLEFISLMPNIDDEIFILVNNSINKLESFHSYDYWLVENLLRLLGDNTEKVAKIYIRILRRFLFAEHQKEEVEEILEYLYTNGFKREANQICNLYGESGVDQWMHIYEKYNG